ncbi:MAG: 50S ribosomal protein L6 [Chloroflexi bacterium]|nr:50S ribosomal protein L6 [Chloroflexota bacterium]
MSRVGTKPIPVPPEVKVEVRDGEVAVTGPKGTLSERVHQEMRVRLEEGWLLVERPTDERKHRALHGLTRALLANMVTGVTKGYEKTLEIVGVGYRVQKSGQAIALQVGFSRPVEVQPTQGLTLDVEGNNRILVKGISKQQVGDMAARIRRIRPPDSYKGKGIRYLGEVVHLKPGKSAGRK